MDLPKLSAGSVDPSPSITTAPGDGPDADTPVAITTIVQTSVDEELAHARSAFEKTEFALAYLHLSNARALRSLLPPDAAPSERDIAEFMRQLVSRLGQKSGKCFVCDGTGVLKQPIRAMNREIRVQTLDRKACPACDGRRLLPAHTTVSEVRRERTRAGRAFRRYHQDRNSTRLGGVMVPPELDGRLSARQLAGVLTLASDTCPDCLGDGHTACDSCNGIGRRPCDGARCIMGQGACPDCSGTGRMSTTRGQREVTTFCSHCQRRGIVTCDTCEGHGWLVCTACGSDGEQSCKTCRGTGEPKYCSRCDGEGLSACRRCRGGGEYRGEACVACNGGGEVICTSCDGAGRSSRR